MIAKQPASPSTTFRFLHGVHAALSVLSGFAVWRWLDTGNGAWAGLAVVIILFTAAALVDVLLVGLEWLKADR